MIGRKKVLSAEKFRPVMQTQQYLLSLADRRPPIPPNEGPKRTSYTLLGQMEMVQGTSNSNEAIPRSAGNIVVVVVVCMS